MKWAMLAYQNNFSPATPNSTILTIFKRNYVELTSYTIDVALDVVAPVVQGNAMTTIWSPSLDLAPPSGGWTRQTRFRSLWTHTVTFDQEPLRGTLRMFIRTRVIAVANPPDGLIYEPSLSKTVNCSYAVSCRVGSSWKSVSTTFQAQNFLELNKPDVSGLSSEIIWGTTIFAKLLPKSTGFRVNITQPDWSNVFGVVGSTTPSNVFQGTGAFMLESTSDMMWWYTDLTPREMRVIQNDERMRTVYTRRDELQNLIRATVEQFEYKVTP